MLRVEKLAFGFLNIYCCDALKSGVYISTRYIIDINLNIDIIDINSGIAPFIYKNTIVSDVYMLCMYTCVLLRYIG